MKKKHYVENEANILSADTSFYIREAYNAARTNLTFSLAVVNGCRKVIVTSPGPGEGKTTTCINLAIAFAQTGARVLVVDADLRRAMIHKYIGIKNAAGLSNVLGGFTKLDEVIKKTRYGFDCMTAGPVPPNAAELLMSDIMSELLAVLSKHYDYIFIDTPPVTVVSDVLALSKLSSGVLLTIRQDSTTHDKLSKAISALKFADAKILGFIYNGASISGDYYSNEYYSSHDDEQA